MNGKNAGEFTGKGLMTGRSAGYCRGKNGSGNGNPRNRFNKGLQRSGAGHAGKGICRRLYRDAATAENSYYMNNGIAELKRQAEILSSSLAEISLKIKEFESE